MNDFYKLIACLPAPPGFAWDWAGLKEIPALSRVIDAMAATPHIHASQGEGSVWEHTHMACEAMAALWEFRAMEEHFRNVLALAALLHDMGKPECTRSEDGRLSAPNHEAIGARLARRLLWRELGLCGVPEAQQLREAVCLYIKYHSHPMYFADSDSPETDILMIASNGELAPLFTLRGLCLLARADRLGSFEDDDLASLERIDLARKLCWRAGCFDGPYRFPSMHTQRRLFAGGQVWKDAELYDYTWGDVILLCGLPGTGKDAWIQSNYPLLPVVSPDDLILSDDSGDDPAQMAQEAAIALLRQRRPFIWNAASITGLRSELIELFEQYHARVRVVFLETEWEENLRRNAAHFAAVSEDVIEFMLHRLEPPERFEAQAVKWACT